MRFWILCVMLLPGCSELIPSNQSQKSPSKGQEVTVKLQVVDGRLVVTDGKLSVGDGELKLSGNDVCPCCGTSRVCQGVCSKSGCTCSRGQNSAASTAGQATGLPQFTTQTQMVYECRQGKCGWYPVEVRVPIASATKRLAAPMTHGGKIKVYTNGSPACVAMRQALQVVEGVSFQQIPENGIAGVSWTPTAMKPDGSTWTPGAGGWHGGSRDQFLEWVWR